MRSVRSPTDAEPQRVERRQEALRPVAGQLALLGEDQAAGVAVDELSPGMLRQSPASQGLDPSQPEINEPAPD